jgi:prolyl-tRNA editing enzyme YbaK/EbsC (Cys-tRNA(Pro) deacylase)
MKGPLDVHQHLLAHDVHHEIVRLRHPAPGIRTLADSLGLPPSRCVAVHPFHAATASGDTLALVLAPADTDVDETATCRALAEFMRLPRGARTRFQPASPSLVSRHTDYLAGHVCPLLLPSDVAVFVTQSLAGLATAVVYMASGDIGTAVALRALDLVILSHARVLPEGGSSRRRRPVTIDLTQARRTGGSAADGRDGLPEPTPREIAGRVRTTRAAS